MSTIQVKPAPTLSVAAAKVIVHPASGGLLDAAGQVPADGRPWLYDGFTCRMLTDGVILRADDPVFAALAAEAARAQADAEAKRQPDAAPPASTEPVTPPAASEPTPPAAPTDTPPAV